jgi:hypothetical protein
MDRLKPTPQEIRALAEREADPRYYPQFQPIARGPVVAILLLAWVGLSAIPWTLWRLVRRPR